jgi:alpha-tubulin suppressor-like RCC1 family protein
LFSQVSAGSGGQSCGVTTTHAAYCWGSNGNGLLGNGGVGGSSSSPVLVSGGISFAQVSSGTSSNCGVDTSGNAWCWGDGVAGELGNGASVPSNVPVAVSGGYKFAYVSAGGSNNCGITTGGAVFCWGSNSSGQLGNGSTTSSNVPVRVSTPP